MILQTCSDYYEETNLSYPDCARFNVSSLNKAIDSSHCLVIIPLLSISLHYDSIKILKIWVALPVSRAVLFVSVLDSHLFIQYQLSFQIVQCVTSIALVLKCSIGYASCLTIE